MMVSVTPKAYRDGPNMQQCSRLVLRHFPNGGWTVYAAGRLDAEVMDSPLAAYTSKVDMLNGLSEILADDA